MDIYIYYGIFTIIFSIFISLRLWMVENKKDKKLCKKHLKKRKNIFLILTLFSLLILWAGAENSFSETTLMIVWGIHFVIFIGSLGYFIRNFILDKKRIELAQKRREMRG